jgi:hypothetical protein
MRPFHGSIRAMSRKPSRSPATVAEPLKSSTERVSSTMSSQGTSPRSRKSVSAALTILSGRSPSLLMTLRATSS